MILQKTWIKTCCSACHTRLRVCLMCYHVNSQETICRAYRNESNSRGAALRSLRVFISEELYRYKHSYFWNWLKLCWNTCSLRDQHVRLGWTLPQVTVFEEADSKPTATSVARRRPPLSGRLQDTWTAKKRGCFHLRHLKIVWRILCHHGDWIIYPPTDERVVYALWHGRIDPKTLRFISGNLIFTILGAQKQKHRPGASTHYVFYLDVALIFFFSNFEGALGKRTSCRQNVAHLYLKLIQCRKEQHINDHN